MTSEPSTPTSVLALGLLAFGFGGIGVFAGFGTLLGSAATTHSATETEGLGMIAALGGVSMLLGGALVIGGWLLWRGHRAALVVLAVALTLLVVSAATRLLVDEVTFVSALGGGLSLLALVLMGGLLFSDDVRGHIRRGDRVRFRQNW